MPLVCHYVSIVNLRDIIRLINYFVSVNITQTSKGVNGRVEAVSRVFTWSCLEQMSPAGPLAYKIPGLNYAKLRVIASP